MKIEGPQWAHKKNQDYRNDEGDAESPIESPMGGVGRIDRLERRMNDEKPLPPPISRFLAQGITRFLATCIEPGICGHSAEIDFEAIKLDPATPFVDIPKRRRLVCSRCGGRKVSVMPDWSMVARPRRP